MTVHAAVAPSRSGTSVLAKLCDLSRFMSSLVSTKISVKNGYASPLCLWSAQYVCQFHCTTVLLDRVLTKYPGLHALATRSSPTSLALTRVIRRRQCSWPLCPVLIRLRFEAWLQSENWHLSDRPKAVCEVKDEEGNARRRDCNPIVS